MTKYEMLYILSPELSDEDKEALIKKVEDVVTANGGTVEKTDKWGMKKLQYPIHYKSEGYYVLMTFEAASDFVQELKRVVGNNEGILRRLITKVEK
ncbi:MAG: 30S ribosomal protein S6 [Clostridia bacterium]|nr:30S ribosomal protein S6 [Clostridia bacterium]